MRKIEFVRDYKEQKGNNLLTDFPRIRRPINLYLREQRDEGTIKEYKSWAKKSTTRQIISYRQQTCGTHFGETKLVASTTGNPEETSIFINSTFTAVGTMLLSFCNPSLGPTSTIFTNPGILLRNCVVVHSIRK